MTCKEFSELTIVEKHLMIGKVVHLIQEDAQSFYEVRNLILFAEERGLFEDVKFLQNELATNGIP